MEAEREKKAVALLSVVSNTLLVVGKLVAGLLMGSVSVLSEAIHSAIDLLAAVIAFIAVRAAGRPADRGHPFGHGKFENLSGAIEALLIFAAAIGIIIESVDKLLHPTFMEGFAWGVLIMGTSAAVNFFVSEKLFKVGQKTDSLALLADAWHLRTDVWTSIGVMTGLAAMAIGSRFLPGIALSWIDPVVAMGVAALILKAAWDLLRASARGLLDERLPLEEEAQVKAIILDRFSAVRSFHKLRTRKSGSQRFVDFHIVLDSGTTVQASHQLADRVTEAIEQQLGNTSVMVHIEPCDGTCSVACRGGCRVPAEERPAEHAENREPTGKVPEG